MNISLSTVLLLLNYRKHTNSMGRFWLYFILSISEPHNIIHIHNNVLWV